MDPEENLVLACEVVVERRLADAGCGRDVGDAGVVVARRVEELRRLVDDLVSLHRRSRSRFATRPCGFDRALPRVVAHASVISFGFFTSPIAPPQEERLFVLGARTPAVLIAR